MAAVPPYRTGTATVAAGNPVVSGTGTAWNIGVVNGGDFSRNGFSIPILEINSATFLTLAYPPPAGMAGTGEYAITLARAGAADAVTANARLAELVAQLQGFSPFFQSLTDDPNAGTMLDSLGFSAFAKTLIDDGDQAAARGTLGVYGIAEWAQALAAYGYTKFPNGLILQHGLDNNLAASRNITYNIVFPNLHFMTIATPLVGASEPPRFCGVNSLTVANPRATFDVRCTGTGGAPQDSYVNWLALGR